MKTINSYRNKILLGDVQEKLRELPAESVHTMITSPPYWGLRNYGTNPVVFEPIDNVCEHEFIPDNGKKHSLGGASNKSTLRDTPGQKAKEGWTKGAEGNCQHEFENVNKKISGGGYSDKSKLAGYTSESTKGRIMQENTEAATSGFCIHCGAWRGEFGLEPTPELYVEHLVMIFREIWRVLRDDGIAWLNLGDTYWGSGSPGGDFRDGKGGDDYLRNYGRSGKVGNYKPKDLCMIPARAAIALQADAWYIRRDIIWSKKSPMPESVRDRPTTAHEYIYLLTKKPKYYYDSEAVREKPTSGPSDIKKMVEQKERLGGKTLSADDPKYKANSTTNIGNKRGVGDPTGRNKRSVWEVTTQPFADAHFATFPPKLIEPMILAGTSEHGVCADCGAPYERILEKIDLAEQLRGKSETKYDKDNSSAIRLATLRQGNREYASKYLGDTHGQELNAFIREQSIVKERDAFREAIKQLYPNDPEKQQELINYVHDHGALKLTRTVGWKKTCSCKTEEIKPAVVLDPFFGAGTTGLVARRAGRDFVGTEINEKYKKIAEKRLAELIDQFTLL